jgi:undecaprenyl-diphosphatase
VQFALFVPIAWWARKHKQPLVEISLSRFVQRKQSSSMHTFIGVVNTLTGSSVVLNVLVAPVAILMWMRRLRLEAAVTVVSCWTSVLVRMLIKQIIHRPRPHFPFVRPGKKSKGKSFPSGHVVSAVNLWGWLFALGLLIRRKRLPERGALMALAGLFVTITGPARVYLGDHWTTDVIGGYLFGGGWLGLTVYAYLHLRERGLFTSSFEAQDID